ncbi:MAG TPA: YbdD/YjiX family protein [Gemmatimonadaceae bacterium]
MTTIEVQGSKIEDESVIARVSAVIRRVIGAPDYSAYLRHQKAKHPECTVMSEAEFLDEQLTARYSRPGSRCC